MKNRTGSKAFTIAVFITMVFERCCTELNQNVAPYLQTGIVNEFYNHGNYELGLASYGAIRSALSFVSVLCLFYKALADRFGRRPIMLANCLGMTCASLLCRYCPNVLCFWISHIMVLFFAQTGLHMVYYVEYDPVNGKRLFAISKCIGLVGMAFLPYVRDVWLGNDTSLWRDAYRLPLFVSVLTLILTFFFIQETDAFKSHRNEIREVESTKKKLSLLDSIRYIISNRQLLIIVVAFILLYAGGIVSTDYTESMAALEGYSNADITRILFTSALAYAFVSFISSFISKGRDSHRTAIILAIISLSTYAFFLFGLKIRINAYVLGFVQGFSTGCLWMCGDFLKIYMVESSPVDLRSSVVSGAEAVELIFCFGLSMVCIFIMTRTSLFVSNIVVFFATMGVATLLLLKKNENR